METSIEAYHRKKREAQRRKIEDAFGEGHIDMIVNEALSAHFLSRRIRRSIRKVFAEKYRKRFNKYYELL